MNRLQPKHSRVIRWLHWLNVPLLALMIWSGLLIYWANDVYGVRLGRLTLFHFFPEGFYQSLGLKHRLATGMAYHFTFMWFFALNGCLYVLYLLLSGEWRELWPNRRTFAEAWQVTRHELGLSATAPPQGKFNAAQRLAYTGILVMGAGSLLTGLAIYKPTQLAWLTRCLGGYAWARGEHFLLTLGYVVFVVLHVTQVIRAGWNNARAMITGYELVPAKEQEHA